MTSSSLLSHAPTTSKTNFDPQGDFTPQADTTWTFPSEEIGRLLELSSRLDLVGFITPVEAWDRIRQHCGSRGISKRAFQELKTRLVEQAQCNGFGAALDEYDFEETLTTVLAQHGQGQTVR
ncbi:hypothetical protein MMC16_003119 [Acarospora aff. strigata]|nr:hypothetical protein [Acarospora aff. strigata]